MICLDLDFIHLHIKKAIDKIHLLLPLSYFMDCFVICKKKTLNIGVHTGLVIFRKTKNDVKFFNFLTAWSIY